MSNESNPAPVIAGRGHTVTIKVNGKPRQIPWGFSSPLIEGRAAKKLGIEYPATNKKEGQKTDES